MKFRAIPTPVRKRIPQDDPELMKAWEAFYASTAGILEERLAEHGLQELEFAPVGDMIIVYRLPERKEEIKTKTGIVIPSVSMTESMGGKYDEKGVFRAGKSSETVYNHGLLVAAGPEACDLLEEKGVFVGDYVTFAKFAGDEETVGRMNEALSVSAAQGKTQEETVDLVRAVRDRLMQQKMLLRMRCGELQASKDLLGRMQSDPPVLELVRQTTEAGKIHMYLPVMKGTK